MNIRAFILVSSLMTVTAIVQADMLVFASPSFAANGATRTNWLSAIGAASPYQTLVFDDLPDGNINGVVNVYPGITITSTDDSAVVTGNTALMGGSNPIGTKAVTFAEQATATLAFAMPLDYLSLVYIDVSTFFMRVYFEDSSNVLVSGSGAGATGNTGRFFGVLRNDKPKITKVTLRGLGANDGWGVDNIETSQAVPETATYVPIALGALMMMRSRHK